MRLNVWSCLVGTTFIDCITTIDTLYHQFFTYDHNPIVILQVFGVILLISLPTFLPYTLSPPKVPWRPRHYHPLLLFHLSLFPLLNCSQFSTSLLWILRGFWWFLLLFVGTRKLHIIIFWFTLNLGGFWWFLCLLFVGTKSCTQFSSSLVMNFYGVFDVFCCLFVGTENGMYKIVVFAKMQSRLGSVSNCFWPCRWTLT